MEIHTAVSYYPESGLFYLEADFVDDLQADSLDITLLMKTISEEFDIAVEDDAVDNISTVGDAVEFIESYINE